MKTNYSELCGEDFPIQYYDGEEWIPAIVAGCDYHIGITIHAKEDKDNFLMCLIGPYSPLWSGKMPKSLQRKLFHQTVKEIKNKKVMAGSWDKILQRDGMRASPGPSAQTCAFNQ